MIFEGRERERAGTVEEETEGEGEEGSREEGAKEEAE